jgi:hypothetical protein
MGFLKLIPGRCLARNSLLCLFLSALSLIPACGKSRTLTEKQFKDAQLAGKPKDELMQLCGWPDFIAKNVEYRDKGGQPKVAAEMLEYRRLIRDEATGNFFLEVYCDKDGKVAAYELRPILAGTELKKHPADAVQFKGHWYAYYPEKVASWDEAKARCQRMGGYLACPKNTEVHDFVRKLSEDGKSAWLGGYCNDKLEWFWLTGERIPVPGPHWAGGQPNSGPNSWMQFWRGAWHDINQRELPGYTAGFICEWDF